MISEPITGTRLQLSDPSLQDILTRLQQEVVIAVERAADVGPSGLDVSSPCEALAVLAAADRLGHHDRVRQVLYRYGRLQRLTGEFRLGDRSAEGTGCAIWSLVDHARLTADTDYLKVVYRSIRRGLLWMRRRRTPDGSERHAGLMRSSPGRENAEREMGRYASAFWCLAGGQEAARAAAVLDHKVHVHDAETYFQEARRALFRSVKQTAEHRGGPGLPADPDGECDIRSAANLLALIPGDLLPPDQEHVAATLESLLPVERDLSPLYRIALAQHLLRRGEGSLWPLVDHLAGTWSKDQSAREAADEECGVAAAAHLIWLLRNILVSDQHDLMLVAPGFSLLPDRHWQIEVAQAPTRFGPVSFRLERDENQIALEWAPLLRPAPQHLVLPLPARAARLEPPRATFTATRMGLRLPSEGGRFRVELLA